MPQNFSTNPANPVLGLQMLTRGVERGAARKLAETKEKKNMQMREGLSRVLDMGDPEALQTFLAKNPGAAKHAEDALGGKKDYMVDAAKRRLINNEDSVGLKIAEAEEAAGRGEDISGLVKEAHAVMTPEGLEQERKKDLTLLQLFDPKAYQSYMAGKEGITTKAGKPLKLEQLINKRNELPEDSEDRAIYEQAINKEIATPGQTKNRPFIAKLMAEGYVPSTRVTGPMLDAYEAAAVKANEMGNPLTVEALRKMEFEAVKNRSTGSAAGSRLVLARKQGIESAQGLLKDMKITSKKLNYSGTKFMGALQKHLKGQLNDPDFTEYMTQRADSLFILGNVLKQNGLTDKSIEVEEEAFSPSLAPKAFDAWLNTQVRALNRAAQEMNRDYGYGITLLPAFDPGQGGRPTKEQPVPVVPGQHGQTQTKPGAPDINTFLEKARQANPGVSDQELTDYYNKKYGGM